MENLTVNLTEGSNVVEIRQGEALPLKEPLPLIISGYLDSVYEFLKIRRGTLYQKHCHIIVNNEKFAITLFIDETNFYVGKVKGTLSFTQIFKEFGINSGATWTTHQLADFIKMHRAYFEQPSVTHELVSKLRNFQAKVSQDLEKADDKRGNMRNIKIQVVESNIPESFKVVLPIFKGQPAETLELEIFIDPESFECTLVSPDAQEKIHRTTDGLIEEQVKLIKELAEDIVIIYE